MASASQLIQSSVFELLFDREMGLVWMVSCPDGHGHYFTLERHRDAVAFMHAVWAPHPIFDDMTPPTREPQN